MNGDVAILLLIVLLLLVAAVALALYGTGAVPRERRLGRGE